MANENDETKMKTRARAPQAESIPETQPVLSQAAPKDYGLPEVIGDEKEYLLASPHDMTEDVDPAYAGDYAVVHGLVRLPVSDGKGGFLPRGKVFRAGAKLRLSHVDAYRFLDAGIVRRIDGRQPDRTPNSRDAHDAVEKQHREEAERERAAKERAAKERAA